MAERRHGGRRGDARGGGCGEGRGDLLNEEAARQRDLRDIENDDLRQQVRDLQRDIENGDLRQQVRDLQRRLARLEKRRGKSNPMRSNASERRSVDDPLFNDVYGGQSKPVYDKDILSMPVYDEPVYDEDIFSIPVYDKPVYDEDILSMPVYDKPVYDEDIFYELPGLMSQSSPPSVKFDDATEDEGVAVDGDDVTEIVGQVKGGVACISPSPDGDLLAIMTSFGQILVMNFDWALLYEMPLDNSPKGVEVHGSTFSVACFFEASITWRGGSIQFCGEGTCPTDEECLQCKEVVEGNGGGFGSGKRGWPKGSKNRNKIGVQNDGEEICILSVNGSSIKMDFGEDGDKVDSRTSLFQEGEYDAVIEDKTWRLRKIYFVFYLFPS